MPINLKVNLDDKEAKKKLKDLQSGKYKVNLDVDASSIKHASNHMNTLAKSTRNVNTVFGRLKNLILGTFSDGKLEITGYLLVLNEINKAAKKAKDAITDYNKAITDLSIATNMNREQTAKLVTGYNNYAKKLASTTTQVTSAADDWLRAGKTMEEAEELIRDSIMLSKLGQLDSSVSTEDLLAVMNGYDMSVKELNSALDTMVAIDMKAATSSGDIATALKYCASSADIAGVSFNRLAAMIGTVQDKTQASAEVVGTFFNTLLSRYRNVKIGNYLSDDGEDLSDYESVLKSIGIQLRDSQGEFRNFETILDEMAQKWNTLSSVQQAALLKVAAGTRQQNRFSALLEGYNKTLELTEVAANSAGVALEKFNKAYMGSLEAKQNTLQANFESLINSTDLEDAYGGILDATSAMITFVNETNALKGAMTALTMTAAIKAFLSLKIGITEAYISLNQFQQALQMVNHTNLTTNDFTRLLLLTKNLSASQTKLILTSKNLTLTQKKQILMNQGLSESESKLRLQNLGLSTSYTGLKAATASVTNAFKGLFATLKANPLFLIVTAVSAATMAWESYKQKIEEANQKAKESADTASNLITELGELTGKYLKLSKAVKTDDSVKDELLSTQDKLLEKLGLEGETIDELVKKYGSLSEAIRQTSIDSLRKSEIDLLAGVDAARKELEDIGKGYEHFYSAIDRNILSSTGEEAGKAYNVLEKAGVISAESHTDQGGAIVLTGDDTAEGIIQNYKKLEEALEELRASNEFTAEELSENPVYKQLYERMNEMTDYVESYKSAIDSYNEALAQDTMFSSLKGMELPDTKEDFEAFRKELIDTAVESKQFIGTEKEIESAVNAYLATLPEFVQYYSGAIENGLDEAAVKTELNLDNLFTALTNSKDALSNFTSSVKSAYEAYSKLLNPDVSSADILSSLQSITTLVSQMGGSLNWEYISKQSDPLKLLGDSIEYVSEKYANSVLSGAGIDINSKFGQMLANNIIQAQKASVELENLNTNIDSLQSAYSSLADIVETYNETGYLTFDQLQTLLELEPQYLSCLVDESGQLQLDKQAMTELANQRLNDAEAQAVQQAISELGQLALQDETTAVEENGNAFQNQVEKLQGYNEELATTIAEATVGATQIRDLNAAIEGAETQGASDNQIDTVLSNLNTKLKLIEDTRKKLSAGGLGDIVGTKSSKTEKDTTKQFDWVQKAIDEVKARISSLQKVIDSTFSTTEAKTKALTGQIGLINKEIDLQQKAYDAYIAKAESVGLSDKYKDLVQNGAIDIEDIADEDLQKAIENYEKWYDAAQECLDNISDLQEEALQKRVDAYELEVSDLKDIYDRQAITEKQYIDKMLDAWERYYADQAELAQVASQKKIEILEVEKSYLQKVGNAAIALLDDQVDKLEDQKDKATKIYQDQIDALNAQKKPLEYELELMERQKDAADKQLQYQKALYALRRAEQQRENYTYTSDKGFIYKADDQTIKDAKKDVSDAEYELLKLNIQQQIDAIDDQIDHLNDLIDQTEAYYDTQIDGLNAYKEEWQKAIDMEELATNMQTFIDKFGADGLQRLFSQDTSLITNWKQSYLDNMAEIDVESTGTIGNLTKKFQELSGLAISPTITAMVDFETTGTEAANAIANSLAGEEGSLSTAISEVNSKINGGGGSDSKEQSANGEQGQGNQTQDSGSDNLVGAMGELSDTALNEDTGIPAQTQAWANMLDPLQEVSDKLNDIELTLENLNGKTFSINVEFKSSGASGSANANGNFTGAVIRSGAAFASGTLGASKDETALLGELGNELVVRGNRFFTVGNNGAEMFNVKKGDIIFNHQQTKDLLDKGCAMGHGVAYAEGNAGRVTMTAGIRPFRPGDPTYDMMQQFKACYSNNVDALNLNTNALNQRHEDFMRQVQNISNSVVNRQQTDTINIGDIHVTGIQDATGLARAIKTQLPNALLQEMRKR